MKVLFIAYSTTLSIYLCLSVCPFYPPLTDLPTMLCCITSHVVSCRAASRCTSA